MSAVYVFGGANIDIIGRSDFQIIEKDSNIGKVIQTYGGVGRNIAENLAHYRVDVHFISVFGDDEQGKECISFCRNKGMNMDDCLIIPNENTSSYLAILDNCGDMVVAINDMDILRFLKIEDVKKILDKMNPDDMLVLDTNLDEEVIAFILDHAIGSVYVDPISVKKSEKIKNHLSKIHMIKPNIYEAEAISGIKYTGIESLKEMGDYFLSCGVKEIIISLGKDGSIGFTSKSCIRCQCEDLMVVNATGAGDAFMGAYVYSSLLGFDLENKMKFSSAASVCTIEHEASVCDKLSFDFINQRMKQLEFDIKEEKRCI